ncbi:MAG: amidohydrolase family protein [Mesorhizobium sp.]|nr:amidohydrolase family protein [Mesorhizobium sp.]
MRIDAHQHFWAPARGDYGWMHASEALAPLRRDVLPADLAPHLKAADIDATVVVQAAPTVFETEYMLGLADATPWIAKVVGWVDFESRSDLRHLERFARHGKFAGLRPMIQDIPDVNWMHRPDVQWGFEAVVDLDLSFDALGLPVHLDAFRTLFDRYPAMRCVVDHAMKPEIRAGRFDDWAHGIEIIARQTPAFCKLSGLAAEAGAGWSDATLKPYVDHVLSAFGAERVMWGSDWPVLELAGTYANWHAAATRLVGPRAAAQVFGATARTFYRIP